MAFASEAAAHFPSCNMARGQLQAVHWICAKSLLSMQSLARIARRSAIDTRIYTLNRVQDLLIATIVTFLSVVARFLLQQYVFELRSPAPPPLAHLDWRFHLRD